MPLPADSPLGKMMRRFALTGRVDWIGVRPARDVPMQAVDHADIELVHGLVGDRYAGRSGKREVTLIQAEHLPVIASLSGHDVIEPSTLRRNLLVSGVSLVSLIGLRFRIGEVVLEGTGDCDPCSRMEDALGHGAYNAMRGHGGITARVIEAGRIAVGDAVEPLLESTS